MEKATNGNIKGSDFGSATNIAEGVTANLKTRPDISNENDGSTFFVVSNQ